jgi:hypothetical protein
LVPFSFSIFDDADNGTVENTAPVYRLLDELGMRTTKSVWPLRGPGSPGVKIGGGCLDDAAYLQFVLDLKARGFEIALHGVQNGSAERQRIRQGLERFRDLLGGYPKLHTNHSRNRDNIYWGPDRVDEAAVRSFIALSPGGRANRFEGHVPSSHYFWGDICREHIKYVRNLVFDEVNLDLINPSMPYHHEDKPHVQYWFSSTDGSDVERFCRALSEKNQDRLEAANGTCIMYTHFASGFVVGSGVHPKFEKLMRRLAGKRGRFAPVGTILDELLAARGGRIGRDELRRMEWRWMREKLLKGRT